MSSAAEKLKALGTRFDSESQNDAYEAEQSALSALPQIVAVVEDAEFISDYHKVHGDESREAAWLMNLRAALAALDEALS